MANKRKRDVVDTTGSIVENTPNENIYTPNEKIEKPNQHESILQRLQELEEQNKVLSKQVKEAKWDISDQVKESKRKYGYTIDWKRMKEEMFKFRYNVLIDNKVEKAVISSNTIGRPINYQNTNTWNWINKHDVEIIFHDGTKTTMDVLDYINQKFQYEEFVADDDITEKEGKKYYTFHSEKFGTFTVSEGFIN